MTEHKQIEIILTDDNIISVDEGLEEIIANFFHWNIPTCNSCIDDNGNTMISFYEFNDWKTFLQLALTNNYANLDNQDKHHNLLSFLQNKCDINLSFQEDFVYDPNNENTVVGLGIMGFDINLRFPNELLNEFKELFFETLPPK